MNIFDISQKMFHFQFRINWKRGISRVNIRKWLLIYNSIMNLLPIELFLFQFYLSTVLRVLPIIFRNQKTKLESIHFLFFKIPHADF